MSYTFFRSNIQAQLNRYNASDKVCNKELDDLIEILLDETKASRCGSKITLPIFTRKEILRNQFLGRQVGVDGLDRFLNLQRRINELTHCQAAQQFAFSPDSHGEISKAYIMVTEENFMKLQRALGCSASRPQYAFEGLSF